MEKRSISINLAKGRKKSFLDKFIKWALSAGRLIVILTETLALFTFLYRFSLDRQVIDSHDRIAQKQAIVKLLKNNEDKYRNLQSRISIASTLSGSGTATVSFFQKTMALAPKDIVFNNVVLSDDFIKFEAITQSVNSLDTFIKALKSDKKVASVSLDRIENKASNATISVGITAMLKK
ncbi:hypothetical protein C4559_05995 [Candidatus Microgenomates bacterium]|nr:MAG: hypothetical protein C4559_05995 [Candidatus Microgenomates bacterium]